MNKRKAFGNEYNFNQDICDLLLELAYYERNKNRNIYKYNAYRKAVSVLAAHPKRISSGEEARKLNGIGIKIAKKIQEFIRTGKLEKLKRIREDECTSVINLLTKISGVGPVKAKELINAGIYTLEDLKQNQEKLTYHQQLGLKYILDFELKIPRTEVKQIEIKISSQLKKFDSKYRITLCGSYRRGKPECGDIDILLTHEDYIYPPKTNKTKIKYLREAVEYLKTMDVIADTMSIGDKKFMGACIFKGPARRLDIRLIPKSQYYCGLLYFTGSDQFNKDMRAHALQNKFTLNEYCLRPIGSTGMPGPAIPIHSEEDIFEYIDYPYKKPEERNI